MGVEHFTVSEQSYDIIDISIWYSYKYKDGMHSNHLIRCW